MNKYPLNYEPRNLGMSWRWRVNRFWESWITLMTLECLLLDTKDNAIVSKWWDSGMEALSEYQELKPGAAEEAEAWAKMRKVEI